MLVHMETLIEAQKQMFPLVDLFGPSVCSTCGRIYMDNYNIEAIGNMGECLGCDHVRGDLQEVEYATE